MVYWDVICLREPLVELFLLELCELLLQLVLHVVNICCRSER